MSRSTLASHEAEHREKTRSAAVVRPPATIRLGYVPLLDAAPLVLAEELGYFGEAGLRVKLTPELGWGSIRDKLVYGELDAAPTPGGLLFSILLGTHAPACEVKTDLVLNLQGNAITLSRRLWEKGVRDGSSLRLMIRSELPRKPVFAAVSPFSSHLYLLRKWLRQSDIDPDRDVRMAILPPPLVGEHMVSGQIDGFCVGEPWSSAAALKGDGWIVATSEMLELGHPEKVLAVRPELYRQRADEYARLRQALVRACQYCDAPENRRKIAETLHRRNLFTCQPEAITNALVGPFQTGAGEMDLRQPLLIFHRHSANLATREKALWFLEAAVESGTLRIDPAQRRQALDAFQETLISPARAHTTEPQ